MDDLEYARQHCLNRVKRAQVKFERAQSEKDTYDMFYHQGIAHAFAQMSDFIKSLQILNDHSQMDKIYSVDNSHSSTINEQDAIALIKIDENICPECSAKTVGNHCANCTPKSI